MSRTLRPFIPVVAVALTDTALLHVWIRARPLAMPSTTQVALSAFLVVVIAIVLAFVHHMEGHLHDVDTEDQ
jgi:hypothetical protein